MPPKLRFRNTPPRGRPTEKRRELLAELRGFALGGIDVPDRTRVRSSAVFRAALTYLRVGRAFRRAGLEGALPLIPPVAAVRPHRRGHDEVTVFCARDAAWRVEGIARTFGGRHLCLHQSLGICAALRGLGFDVDVVLGYPSIEHADGTDELHAWPVIGDAPLTGRSGERPLNYVELLRYPEEAARWC